MKTKRREIRRARREKHRRRWAQLAPPQTETLIRSRK